MNKETEAVGEDFLSHYGVKGMRWGIRRSPSQLKRAVKERRKSAKDAKAATARTRFTSGSKDAPKNLTDAELEARIRRMDTEKRYNQLNAKTVSTGQQHANELITNIGKKTIQSTVGGLTIYAVKKGVEKKLGSEAASNIPKLKK